MALIEVSLGKEYSDMSIQAFGTDGENESTIGNIATSIVVPDGVTKGIIIAVVVKTDTNGVEISGDGLSSIINSEIHDSVTYGVYTRRYTCELIPGGTVTATHYSTSFIKGLSLMLLA